MVDEPMPVRSRAQQQLLKMAADMLAFAEYSGQVVTISQVPLKPLAMRHYSTVVDVRAKLVR